MLLVPYDLGSSVKAEQRYAEALRIAVEKRKDIERQCLLQCQKCSAESVVGETEYIQTHWYTSPHGCTGGDYWNAGEGQWVCPNGHKNRLHDQPEVVKLKYVFKSIRQCYCEYNRTPCKACAGGPAGSREDADGK